MHWSKVDQKLLMRILGEEVETQDIYQWFEVDSTTTEVEGWASVQRKCGEEAQSMQGNYQVSHLPGTNTHNPSISSKHSKKSSNEILGFLLPVFQLVLHSVSQLAHLLTNMHLFLLRGDRERGKKREKGGGRRERGKKREKRGGGKIKKREREVAT